jgi:hypothetical protein
MTGQAIVNNPVMARVAGVGFFVYGAVYCLLGALAAKVALGTGGRITGSKGVILEVAREPFGEFLLIVIMLGLFAYSIWRFVQALADPERRGNKLTGIFIRGGRLVSSIVYGALAVFTLQLVSGAGRTGGDSNWALRLITEPLGAVVGTIIGLIIVGVGIEQFRKVFTGDFGEPMRYSRMTRSEQTGGELAARLGFGARGVVFTMTGGYLLYAVFDADPKEAKSIDELLLTLLRLPYGDWILAAVALGLAGYGLFMIQVAIHRKHPY